MGILHWSRRRDRAAGQPGLRLFVDEGRRLVTGVEGGREAEDAIADLAAAAALDRERCAIAALRVGQGERRNGVFPDLIGGVDRMLSKGTSLPVGDGRSDARELRASR
jgi:hypothetical protein